VQVFGAGAEAQNEGFKFGMCQMCHFLRPWLWPKNEGFKFAMCQMCQFLGLGLKPKMKASNLRCAKPLKYTRMALAFINV